jgi:hypothetical protein
MAFTLDVLWNLALLARHVLPLFGGLAVIICALSLAVGRREGPGPKPATQEHHPTKRAVPEHQIGWRHPGESLLEAQGRHHFLETKRGRRD